MKKRLRAFTILMLAVASVTLSGLVLAGELSQFTAGKVQKAYELQQEAKVPEAIKMLSGLELDRPFEQAFVNRMLGVLYWQYGQTGKAIAKLKLAVDSGLLEDSQAWVTQRMLADLYMTEESYSNALKYYYPLTKNIPNNEKADDLWLRIAQAHYQKQQWKSVLKSTKEYERVTHKDSVAPLTMKLGAQLQLRHWKGSVPTLKRLIAVEPDNRNWWMQLTSSYMRLDRPTDALSILALAKRDGIVFSTQDTLMMAQLYAQQGIPEVAAQLLSDLSEKQKNEETTVEEARYWQMAKEWDNAIAGWRRASELDNKHRWHLAQLLLQQEHYQAALRELNKVNRSGRTADIELAKARAFYKLSQFDNALMHAKRADEYQPSEQAKSWIHYLSAKVKLSAKERLSEDSGNKQKGT
ncbi:hypothetical protein NF212_19050 [Parasalinivibrio latis]|uniref:tetratricopeptide repeat protein n=1 Tax=Parasalinivibrio latis TaxID=2952610 RepID=UPI0030E4C2B7